MYVHYGAQQTHQQVTVTGPRPDTAGQGPGTATGTNIRVVSSYRLGRMVQGRRSRQRAPGPRRRPAWLHGSLLHAPCSMLPHGDGAWPGPGASLSEHPASAAVCWRRAPLCRDPAAPLHGIATIWAARCRLLAGLAGVEGGGEGGRARCWIGTGGCRTVGGDGTGRDRQENVARGAVGRRSRRGRWEQTCKKGHDGERRRRDFRCACMCRRRHPG